MDTLGSSPTNPTLEPTSASTPEVTHSVSSGTPELVPERKAERSLDFVPGEGQGMTSEEAQLKVTQLRNDVKLLTERVLAVETLLQSLLEVCLRRVI